MKTIAIAGLGYVGMSNAVLLARQNRVIAVDISAERVEALNAGRSPISDPDINDHLASGTLNLTATMDAVAAYRQADYVFIATPTNYDPATHAFDTSSIEAVVEQVRAANPRAVMVIKSTVPVGYTQALSQRLGCTQILFSPEFLREGRALHDNLNPSRIVVGECSARGNDVAQLLADAAIKRDVPILLTDPTEAEAIKLFANTYLALRVAMFNEIDSLAMADGLNAREVIEGLALDPRLGDDYNNPSFGYGGYCLPKDTKQLLANFADVPQALISAIVASNDTRKAALTNAILRTKPSRVGVHRLVMKAGSDNFRESAVQDIVQNLCDAGVDVIVHEPAIDRLPPRHPARLEPDFHSFAEAADIIIANRFAPELAPHHHKLFTRDLFGAN